MDFSNAQVAKKLRDVASALTVKGGNRFQIRAYETAADAIEHSTAEIKDLWEENQLDKIPGVGENLHAHLDELFKTGKVRHWQDLEKGLPEGFFEFLDIPGVGPKIALKLSKLGAKDFKDLGTKLESGLLQRRGFSQKIAEKILSSLQNHKPSEAKRMLLPYAWVQAEKVISYLKSKSEVIRVDALGSLRRMVATIGDLDFAVASKDPGKIVEEIVKMPGVKQVLDQGETEASVVNSSGLKLDFIVTKPENYGALLQHFTGSKQHNIHLRTVAERKGLSLSEYGVKNLKTGKIEPTETEEEFYKLIGMAIPPPEIREDTGEIEAALGHGLPKLVEPSDIKGDLHIHDNFPIEPSHDLGQSSLEEIVEEAHKLDYQYLGISDHSPSVGNHSEKEIIDLIKKHTDYIEQFNTSKKSVLKRNNITRVLNLLEVDIQPDGSLSVPDEGLKLLDFAIASIHSSFNQKQEEMTKRILKALGNPYVKVLGHPTGRLINQRESYEADWEKIFKYAASHQIAMEINAFPDRLDLPDYLVRMAKGLGVKFVIDTDSHVASQMEYMRFGVAVARRGWLEVSDVLNTWELKKFAGWFKINM